MTAKDIIEIRTKLNKSVAEFADMIGVSRYSVYLYEAGKRLPRSGTRARIEKLIRENKDK